MLQGLGAAAKDLDSRQIPWPRLRCRASFHVAPFSRHLFRWDAKHAAEGRIS